jgi:hypothetical protein
MNNRLKGFSFDELMNEVAVRIAQDHIDQLDDEDRKTLATKEGRSERATELVELQDVGLEDRVLQVLEGWAFTD